MNYRHAFHAGNFADVVKHIVLARVLVYLARKDAAFRVLDTHAGAGLYDLGGEEASRTGEWEAGVAAALATPLPAPVEALIAPWRAAINAANPQGFDTGLAHYPGSPFIARHLSRPQDRMLFCESEPGVRAALAEVMRADGRVKVLPTDGWQALSAYLPPKERRGLVLIDPPFEEGGEFHRLAEGLVGAHRRWEGGVLMAWYPIKDVRAVDAFRREVTRAGIPKTLRIEFDLAEVRQADRLSGAGLVVVNPPFTLAEEMRTVMTALAPRLAHDGRGRVRIGWLMPER
ncbi:23S rRNA (adenine(2030)-N(6))-methyltransferase RlmJ [Ancylobacter sp. 6x-1]|uniref:Ribosomal RNA large subunit methyltransferase J n=1 Tax=Ancylobacter crimeensis TaxID=2579147 RepID=A0ABT0D9S0_9HYPH|nr:23S rRNA (adenine(2030)-N(6))-methyltransferase RlmJ [Ancylobacter crimeensis]MCK0196701.1 23S rRNA (adenine(2030)-N(6))-methyltransferase RlmJ [Ancylobacter crimeensis]